MQKFHKDKKFLIKQFRKEFVDTKTSEEVSEDAEAVHVTMHW